MKILNASFEVENDLAEHNLRQVLEGMGAKHLRTLPNTEHLKEDKHYKALSKAERDAKKAKYKYVNNHR